jgi:hypothetical protein
MLRRRGSVKFLVATMFAVASFSFSALAGSLAGPYTDSSYLDSTQWIPGVYTPWSSVSHWIQPWRAWLTTVPASQFINGIGIQFSPSGVVPDLAAEMLAKHGFTHVRLDIGWGNLDYQTETMLGGTTVSSLQAAQSYGLRPVIILNSNQAAPCPFVQISDPYPSVTVDAPAGSTTVTLDDATRVMPGYSGFFYQAAYTMNYPLITAVNGNTVTLSQPLPYELPVGPVQIDTLKYRPFAAPGDPEYDESEQQNTLSGWNKYVEAVAKTAATYLGTAPGSADMGFDLEVWNEFTSGSLFLSLPTYYNQSVSSNLAVVTGNILTSTANYLTANPDLFNGVVLEDGFANENIDNFAGMEPERVGAMGKHLYPPQLSFPGDQSKTNGTYMLNALLALEAQTGTPPAFPFVPTYTSLTPEYFGTLVSTPSPIQDLCPFTTYDENGYPGNPHGENSRVINGQVVPCTIFVTEIGVAPDELNPQITDAATAMLVKAKADSRMLVFYLNKGATQVDLFCAASYGATAYGDAYGDLDFQLFSQNFIDYATPTEENPNPSYPDPDTNYVSPALKLISNIVAKMKDELDSSINSSNTRPLTVTDIISYGDNYQFQGDGTAAHPPGYDQERFAFLPYQVNAKKFVIPYYIMTADITKPMTSWEVYTVNIQGINGIGATVTAYDPLNDTTLPMTTNAGTDNTISVNLVAADYPYLLIIQEAD